MDREAKSKLSVPTLTTKAEEKSIKHSNVKKKKKGLILSSVPLFISSIMFLFSDSADLSFEVKKFSDIYGNHLKGTTIEIIESMYYDVIIYDDSEITNSYENLSALETNNMANTFINGNNKSKSRIIIYTGSLEPFYLRQLIKNGIIGIVSKFSEIEKLNDAVVTILGGESYYCEKIQETLYKHAKYDAILTEREQEICYYLKIGRNYKEISQKIKRKTGTINKHIENIKIKLDVYSLTELRNKLKA